MEIVRYEGGLVNFQHLANSHMHGSIRNLILSLALLHPIRSKHYTVKHYKIFTDLNFKI